MALAVLTIDINAKLANIERDLGKVAHLSEQSAQSMQRSFEGAGKALGALGGALASAGLVAGLKGVIDTADDLGKLSQKIGISVEDLAGFKHAADLSGISIEQFGQGVKQMSRYMGDYGGRLKAAGITATDAKGALIQLADAFSQMGDGTQKTAIAMEILGKSGAEMIPLLNGGGAALRAMIDEGQRFNPVTAEMARHAERFNDALSRLESQTRTYGITLGSVVLGPMADWLEANIEATRIAGNFGEAMRLFVFNLDAMTTEKPREEIRRLAEELARYQKSSALGQFFQSPFGGFEEDHRKKIEFLKYLERQAVMAGAAQLGDYRDARDLTLENQRGVYRLSGLLGAQAKDKAAREVRERVSPFAGLHGFDDNRGAAEIMRELQAQDRAVEALAQKYTHLADPLQKYREQLAEIAELKDLFPDKAHLWEEAELKVNDAMHEQLARLSDVTDKIKEQKNLARELGLTFTSAFEDAIVGGKKFSAVLQGVTQDILRLAARKTVTEPLISALSTINFGSLFSFNAAGGVYSGPGISAFSGQVVSRPTVFPFASGIGLMGEAGPEAILPLKRSASGRLGVEGGGSMVQVNIIEAPGKGGQQQQRTDGNGTRIIEVLVEQVKASVAGDIARGSGVIPSALSSTYGLNRVPGAY